MMIPVAFRLRRLRQERGWTALQLAERCGQYANSRMTRATIAKLESGVRRSISAEELDLFAKVFEVPVEELLKPESDREALIRFLNELRHEAGDPPVKKIAQASGIAPSVVLNVFTGRTLPSQNALKKIASALGGDVEHLELVRQRALNHHDLQLREVDNTKSKLGPSYLPPSIGSLIGRDKELNEIHRILTTDKPYASSSAPPIVIISGPPGVGKTALAIHAARSISSKFPDGQFYFSGESFLTGDAQPNVRDAALDLFLNTLVSRQLVPPSTAEKVALFRTLTSEGRYLFLLDDVTSANEVRRIIPPSNRSAMIISSRLKQPSLVARDAAHQISLERLSTESSMKLLADRVGVGAVHSHPAAAHEIVDLCEGLPLAITLISALVSSGTASLERVIREVKASQDRVLEAFTMDSEDHGLRASILKSYAALPADAIRLFVLLVESKTSKFTRPEIEVICKRNGLDFKASFGALVSASFLSESAPDEFRMHDLIRAFGTEQMTLAGNSTT